MPNAIETEQLLLQFVCELLQCSEDHLLELVNYSDTSNREFPP